MFKIGEPEADATRGLGDLIVLENLFNKAGFDSDMGDESNMSLALPKARIESGLGVSVACCFESLEALVGLRGADPELGEGEGEILPPS